MKKVAVVGYGFMGRTHIGVWRKLKGAKLVAVCVASLDELKAKVVGNNDCADNRPLAKSVRVYTDFDKMIADGGFDIVDITVPTPLHRPMSVAALEAGYDVLCEKPMAVDVASCDAMLAAARRSGRKFLIAQCVRFNPAYAFLKELVDSGRYGRVVAADFTRFCPLPGWGANGKSWFLDEAKSGGAAVDMHVHDADFIQHLFGLPPAVMSSAHRNADGLTDYLATTYRYADKVVTSDTSWAAAKSLVFDSSYRVFFDEATVYCGERYGGVVTVYPMKGKPFVAKIAKGTSYQHEIRAFLDWTEGRRDISKTLTARDARNAIALVTAERASAKTGKTVRLQPSSLNLQP